MTDTLVRASLAELFDQHASLVIDGLTYRTNATLRDFADRIFDLAGVTAHDVSKSGVQVYRTYAKFDVWENTSDGAPIIRDGCRVTRPVTVEYTEGI